MTDNFKKWFGDSVVVNEDGSPMVVYHGTTHDFDSFELERGNTGNAVGTGYYFTTSPEDASINYAGEGADLTSRIEAERDKVASELEYEYDDVDDVVRDFGVTEEEAQRLLEEQDPDLIDTLAIREAKKRMKGEHDGAIIPAYIKIENPFDMTDEEERYGIEWDEEYYVNEAKDDVEKDDYIDEDGDFDEESYNNAVMDTARTMYYEDYSPSEDGNGVELVDALRSVVHDSKYYIDDPSGKVYEFEHYLKEYSPTAKDVYDKVVELFMHEQFSEDGNLANHQIFRDMIVEAGFDGAIQDAYAEFGRARKSGAPMEGIEYGDKHYIVFEPTQIKSAIGNSGEYDPNNPNIIMREGGQTPAQKEKIAFVMGEFKDGKLKTSYGEKVTDRKQAIAIALSEAGVEKMYRGGELGYYNKWKETNWESLPYGKNKAKLYRLLSWIESERIEEYKLPEDEREFLEAIKETYYNYSGLEDMMEGYAESFKWDYDSSNTDEERKIVLDAAKKYGLTEKDLKTDRSEIDYEELASKIVGEIGNYVDFYTIEDESFDKFETMMYEDHRISMDDVIKFYDDLLMKHGEAVYTEEAEEIQYDLFDTEKEMPKPVEKEEASEIELIKLEIDSMTQLESVLEGEDLENIMSEKESLLIIYDALSEDGVDNIPKKENGGIIIDENNIFITTDDFLPRHISFHYRKGKEVVQIGYASIGIYFSDEEILYLQEYKITDEYNKSLVHQRIIQEIKRILPRTGKKKILANNSIY